jgi:hypothetical protein
LTGDQAVLRRRGADDAEPKADTGAAKAGMAAATASLAAAAAIGWLTGLSFEGSRAVRPTEKTLVRIGPAPY